MKKTVIFLMLLVMLTMVLMQPVAAAGLAAKIEAKTTSVKPGDTIEFAVSISGDAACQTLGLQFDFDKSVFEVVKGKSTIKDAMLSTFDKERGVVALFQSNTVPSGEIATMILQVKENAPAGEATVTFKTAAKDEKSAEVPFTCNTVTIKIAGTNVSTTQPTTPAIVQPTAPTPPTAPSNTAPEVHVTTPEAKDPEATVGQENGETVDAVATAPVETEDTIVAQPDASDNDSVESSNPTESVDAEQKANEDIQWGVIGLILAVVIIAGGAAYFFVTKKRQK